MAGILKNEFGIAVRWREEQSQDTAGNARQSAEILRSAGIGRIVLLGNVNPLLIHSGTPEQVREATRNVIEKLAHYRGLIIQDGSNIPPGTPIENINAMTEAAELYGRYE